MALPVPEEIDKPCAEKVYVCGYSFYREGGMITLVTRDAEQAARHIASMTGGDERIFEVVELGVECGIHV